MAAAAVMIPPAQKGSRRQRRRLPFRPCCVLAVLLRSRLGNSLQLLLVGQAGLGSPERRRLGSGLGLRERGAEAHQLLLQFASPESPGAYVSQGTDGSLTKGCAS